MTVLTPTVRQSTRRSLFWIGALVFTILAAIGSLLLVGAATDTVPLSPTSAAPDGAMALAEVLEQQGVDVVASGSLAETTEAADDPGRTTIAVYDPDELLDDSQRTELLGLADHLVVLRPGFDALRTFAPGVTSAGAPDDDALTASCELPAATRAGDVTAGGSSYRVADDAVSAETCLLSVNDDGQDSYSLVQLDVGTTTVSVVGATDALTNGQVLQRGNAAFALNLLGDSDTLVWYLPTLADVVGAGDAAALTPPWLTPVITLLTITALVAALWRGRRFGPLIIENLPVVVRASETMEGRARLYQRGSARLRALDALRIGTITRLAALCGLGSSASVDEIVLGAAAVTVGDPRDVRRLLVEAVPVSDADLVALSDRLLALEADVAAAVRG